ncbi:PREDICTED: uncharacterized protein LOC105950058 [Erythranthe guttata]|uniref:uncharacterized protein LOC105950058 n=1 Tax=Erythranthe guttata TaxID=4155 RepID=UPI00064E1238|nr:PREDICTED: uncharacterized protein LOC105950058 [Erythranthe guttata]|eukprot:XP_012828832.1 PREDICTED: uncharacterized protein LOC105950058 [Erythranthe guttata]
MNTATSDSSSVGLVTRSMAKKLQASSKTSSTPQTIQKGLPPLVNTSAEVEGSKREMSQSMPHSTSSYSEMASVMTTNATTMEEQIANLTKAIEGLTKHVQQRDSQIAKLINKMDKADASQAVENQIEVQDEVETSTKQQPVENEKAPAQELQVSPEGLIHVDQVMTLISETIKDKLEGGSKSPSTYVKPYTQMIDDLRMPMGYIYFQSFNNLTAKATPSNMLHTSSRLAMMPGRTEITSSRNSSDRSKTTRLIGTLIWGQTPLIVGSTWRKNFSTAFTALEEQST